MIENNLPVVSVIVPARNEEASLGACLESLVAQSGIDFEIIVVDDGSTDRTAEIARSYMGSRAVSVHARHSPVSLISAAPLLDGWTGKNNAMSAGAKVARGKWLLFTDADTVHQTGSLARAVAEAEQNGVALLSYSPEQQVRGFLEKAVMPVIFAELAATYPPQKVSDPASPIAAANGQYLLISREAYAAVGGHAKIAGDLLEDVALARMVKSSGRKLLFRYGGGAVRTRMYRNWAQMREGWTKNLALLFKHPVCRAAMLLAFWAFSWVALVSGVAAILSGYWKLAYYGLPLAVLYVRVARANFRPVANIMAIAAGVPLASYLLVSAARMFRTGSVTWKGRTYRAEAACAGTSRQ
jgi:glycosyltransferase involved in cell wall biosynthesis